MKLSKLDIRILMAIKLEGYALPNYKIAKRLHRDPAQTFRRLKSMLKHHVLQEIDSWPRLYNFNSNGSSDFILASVECPYCQVLHVVHHSQVTIQCSCKTASGKPRRFFVYERRVKNLKVLNGQVETRLQQAEIEKDVSDIIDLKEPK